jgi:tetratricopeptide (TPR) repeat protein
MKLHQKISLILFGLFLTIVILEIGLRIGGFAILSIQEYRNQQSIKQKGSFRIMCLGESTTQDQYPPYLEEILNQSGIEIKFSVIDKGMRGTNTELILSKLRDSINKYQPDMVVTMMGINDRGSHVPYNTVSASKILLTLRSFRVYKLTRFLWLHITTKLKEAIELNTDNDLIYMGLGKLYKDYGKYAESEQSFKKAIELNPNSDSAYIELGWLYKIQGKLAEAEQAFKKAIELNPNSDLAYKMLGMAYKDYGKYAESEQSFKKAIELNPNSDSIYEGLAWLYYRNQWKFSEAEQAFKKAIELNPNSCSAYIGLGRLYTDFRKFSEAEQAFKKAIELNPKSDYTYQALGWLYKAYGKYAESEQSFKKAIELNPNKDSIYIELSRLYTDHGKFSESEQVFKKAIELNLKNDCFYGSLATIYCEIGNNELSEVYAKKAESLRGGYLDPDVINNYHVLKQILDKRKIKLVCVQYPMRNIRPLKKIFKEEMEDGIIFVDNEKVFKDAVRKEGYKEYFRDMFGGDFGHCTPKGNRLLAENIANVILKEYFNK